MKESIRKHGLYISMFILVCIAFLAGGCDNSTESNDSVLPPGAPSGLSASDGTADNLISSEWIALSESDVSFYRLYRAPVIDGITGSYILRQDNLHPDLNPEGTAASFDDNKLSRGKIYSYRVSAVNDGGESELSAPETGYADTLTPNLPVPPSVNLRATNNQVGMVYLDWDAVPGATRYHIYRSSSPMGEYGEIAVVIDVDAVELNFNGSSEFYAYCDDSNIWPDGPVQARAFYYRVSSENSEGEGLPGDIINGWFPYPVIEVAPENLTATRGDFANKTVVTWDSVENATSYVIYRSLKSGDCETPGAASSYSQLAISSGTSYDDSTGTVEVEYCYTVRARNEAGESNAYSIPYYGHSSSTGLQSPGTPTDLAATDDGVNIITVSWTRADSIATHYLVYRSTGALSGYTLVAAVADAAGDTWNDGNGSIGSVPVDTTYYYKIKAVVYEGANTGNPIITESSLTDYESGFAYPAIPGLTTVTASDDTYWNRIAVSWTALERTETYTIYRKIGIGGDWVLLEEEMTTTSYLDDSAEVAALWDTSVTYRVYGVNSNSESNPDPENGSETASFGEDIGTVELQAPSINSEDVGIIGGIETTWDTIPCDDLAGRIEYALYWKKESDGSWQSPEYLTYHDYDNGYTFQIDGLSGWGTTYQIYVVPIYTSDGHVGPQSNMTNTDNW